MFLSDQAYGPRITVISTVSISPGKHVLVSSVSSRFLEHLLNEASASGDMQQTCRKASCGRCPWDEPDPYLASQLQGDYPGAQLCSCKHSCAGCTALRPSSCLVKPARKQGLNYCGKSTELPLVILFILCLICTEKHCLAGMCSSSPREVTAAHVFSGARLQHRQLIDLCLPVWPKLQ